MPGQAEAAARAPLGPAAWALLGGNFVVACGVMSVSACLNDVARDLQVSVAAAGQLVSVAAAAMMVAAPLFAAATGGQDRRRQLTFALLWCAAGHVACATASSYPWLLFLRALTVLSAALYTPQAAAAIGHMVAPAQRGRAITFVFLGWSVASVLGMPLAAGLSAAFGWRWAFGAIGGLSVLAAGWVWWAMPQGVRPPALSRAQWAQVAQSPRLLAIVAVTALSSAGQFALFTYVAPYYAQVLKASDVQISLLFGWFGACGVLGSAVVSRHIDHCGAPATVAVCLGMMVLSLLLWPLPANAWQMALVTVPWGLACFAANSAQQARLSLAAPALTSALVALNSSAMYLGQMAGATSGGALLAASGLGALHGLGAAWMVAALALSLWAGKQGLRGLARHG